MTLTKYDRLLRRIEALESRHGGVRVFHVKEGDPEPPDDGYRGLTVIIRQFYETDEDFQRELRHGR